MAALLSVALALFLPSINAQAYDAAERSEDAFSYVQPLNTTILGPYGNSPPVLPSRTYAHTVTTKLGILLTVSQRMPLVLEAGRRHSRERKRSLPS